jgi:hypothetical protein
MAACQSWKEGRLDLPFDDCTHVMLTAAVNTTIAGPHAWQASTLLSRIVDSAVHSGRSKKLEAALLPLLSQHPRGLRHAGQLA